jgi:hypothetical protein
MLSGMRTVLRLAYGEDRFELRPDKTATDALRALGKQVRASVPRYTHALDLGPTLTYIAEEGLRAKQMDDSKPTKHKIHRDAAIFLKRMMVLSRSDDEAKWSVFHLSGFKCFDGESGAQIGAVLIEDAIQQTIDTDGEFREAYFNPKDPHKVGEFSRSVRWKPIRVELLVDPQCPWLRTKEHVEMLCPARRIKEYVRLMRTRPILSPATAHGGTWCAVTSAKAHQGPGGLKVPLTSDAIANVVKQIVKKSTGYDDVGGHFLRGNGGSITRILHNEEGATWAYDEHLDRARHTAAVFQSNYAREVPLRIIMAFRNHACKHRLRFEEALLL